jgi:response regulator of citrate/malate metabolism
MGRGPTEQETSDLFSADGVKASGPSSSTSDATKGATETALQRYVLPKNLRHALKHLSDSELDEFFQVAFDEAKRRGRLPRSIGINSTPSSRHPPDLTKKQSSLDKSGHQRKVDGPQVSLTRGQVNAVRSAFKAGITPSQIARQFGISQANVRKALASDEPRR